MMVAHDACIVLHRVSQLHPHVCDISSTARECLLRSISSTSHHTPAVAMLSKRRRPRRGSSQKRSDTSARTRHNMAHTLDDVRNFRPRGLRPQLRARKSAFTQFMRCGIHKSLAVSIDKSRPLFSPILTFSWSTGRSDAGGYLPH